MNCPKCGGVMQAVPTKLGECDRCKDCGGLWFDYHEDVEMLPLSRDIDTGDEYIGIENDMKTAILCPKCTHVPMLRETDPQQPHIWFEACPQCKGRYFDAGEFTDLSEYSFSDWIEGIIARVTALQRHH